MSCGAVGVVALCVVVLIILPMASFAAGHAYGWHGAKRDALRQEAVKRGNE